MQFEIHWKKHSSHAKFIVGHVKELPDGHIRFMIGQIGGGKYWVLLPARGIDNHHHKIILSNAQQAREFCTDYLHYNFQKIIQYQVNQMKRSSMETIKPPYYYEGLLDKYSREIEELKIPSISFGD